MKYIRQLYLVTFFVLSLFFLSQGLTQSPSEGDSLAYHLPIAENILHGKWTDFENPENLTTSLLQYYPASSHLILALFVALHAPELFNVVGFFVFALSCYFLSRTLELPKSQAICLAIVLATLTSAVRLILTQTIDIWVAIFFTLSLVLLLKPKESIRYGVSLGMCLGMLIGSKYTGLGFAVLLLLFFFPKHWKTWTQMVLPILILGLSWYLRNFVARGDFLYPASHPAFHLDEWTTWQSVTEKHLFLTFVQDLISEFSIWAGALILGPLLVLSKQNRKIPFFTQLIGLGIGCFVLHLITPASPQNMLSDLRYTIPTFICLVTALFLWAKSQGRVEEFFVLAFIPILSIFSLAVPHQPKLFFVGSVAVLLCFSVYKRA